MPSNTNYFNNFFRYILTAEMLKPTISNPEDEFVDHFPHLILLHNKAQMGDFSPKCFKRIQEVTKILKKSDTIDLFC